MTTATLPQRRPDEAPEGLDARLERLDRKLDRLGDQVGHLYQRTVAMEELKDELMPLARDAMGAMQEELGAIEHEFNSDEIAYLLRKVLRNTPRFIRFLDRLEALDGLMVELEPLSKEVLRGAVDTLQQAEDRGWFRLLRGGLGLMDEVAAHASDEDIQRLHDNVLALVDTVKQMTQPQMLTMANETLRVMQAPASHHRVGVIGLMRALRDPEIQEGVGVLLELLRQTARTPKTHGASHD